MRALTRLAVTAAVVLPLGVVGTVPAQASPGTRSVSVGGEVAAPASYTAADLAALPQTTYPVSNPGRGPGTVTGVSLLDLVQRSAPVLPPGKNTGLRFTVSVRGHVTAVFALGELDPNFGNHPAVLTPRGDLVVPGDANRLRSIGGVTEIRLAASTAVAVSTPAGSVQVRTPHRTVTLSANLLAHLPTRTLTVTFQAGTTPQTHTETGPPLALALLAAGVLPLPGTPMVTVGSDSYAATVTPAEEYVGGRPLLLSTVEDGAPLARPRLVPDGDVKGGRYVSDAVLIAVG